MRVERQADGVYVVAGLPRKWGVRAYRQLEACAPKVGEQASKKYTDFIKLLDRLEAAPVPLDSTEAQLVVMAEDRANECKNIWLDISGEPVADVRRILDMAVREHRIEPPTEKDDQQAVLRAMDGAWWRRNLRRAHMRALEAAAIRLGFVSSKAGKYCSDEAAVKRVAQNRRNQDGMRNTKMQNLETGQEFNLADLAAKGMGNNKNRRGEFMLRLAGCDKIYQELDHIGIFVTLTAPGAYHAVMHDTGEPNPKFNDATPRETQEYLRQVWTLARAQNARDGLSPYGFRVAEPHHDGCPHWHMVVFMPRAHVETFKANLSLHALAEDGESASAQAKRVTYEELDPKKGSVAAYMAKYIAKNIGDGKLKEDKNGNTIITKEMRVDAWAAVWGIRQFQPMGMPPVTVYREMRRLPKSSIKNASESIRAAWAACNREIVKTDDDGVVQEMTKCDFAAYIRAQGGVNMGRDYLIAMETEGRQVAGRYGLQLRDCPVGVLCRSSGIGYASIRYTWKRSGAAFAVALRSPWSPVNNCTAPHWAEGALPGELVAAFDDEWFKSDEYQKIFVPPEVVEGHLTHAIVCAHEIDARTVWTKLSSDKKQGQKHA